MAQMQIKITLSAADALASCSTQYGELVYQPTSEELGQLSEAERALLASHVGLCATCLHVRAHTWAAIREGLEARRLETEQQAAKLAAAIETERNAYRAALVALENGTFLRGMPPQAEHVYAPNYGRDDGETRALYQRCEGLRAKEVARLITAADAALGGSVLDPGVQAILAAGREHAVATPVATRINADAIHERAARALAEQDAQKALERLLLVEHGTPDQVERYDAGVLSRAEFEAVAKCHLFAANAPLYVPLEDDNIQHDDYCAEPTPRFRAKCYDGPLTQAQFARLKALRAAAPAGAEVEVREHEGYCPRCSGTVERLSVRVTLTFAGEEYAREYAMPDTIY